MGSLLQEKTRLDAEQQMLTGGTAPDYDDLIESALDSLDVYQARRADMNLHLKKAFFNLAQAKLALGPARVGPANYHLGRTEPLLTVDITGNAEGLYTYTLIEGKPACKPDVQPTKTGKERESRGIVDLRYDASTSAVKLDELSDEKSQGGGLRRRMQGTPKQNGNKQPDKKRSTSGTPPNEAGEANTAMTAVPPLNLDYKSLDVLTSEAEEDAPPTYSDSVNEYLLDPMQQFSAFPPVTLRKAQTEFRQSLRLATALLSEQQRFKGMSAAASQASCKGGTAERL